MVTILPAILYLQMIMRLVKTEPVPRKITDGWNIPLWDDRFRDKKDRIT
jgi:hypothetical protein